MRTSAAASDISRVAHRVTASLVLPAVNQDTSSADDGGARAQAMVCQRGSNCPCLRGASIIAAARFCQLHRGRRMGCKLQIRGHGRVAVACDAADEAAL